MPTDHPAQTNRIDDEGFPIAIGFQSVADKASEADSQCNDCDSALSDEDGMGESQSLERANEAEQEPLVGYELVEDMMRRQDEVLSQLDDLNARIESAIKEISAARKSEIEALEAEPGFDSGDSASPADQPIDQRKAA